MADGVILVKFSKPLSPVKLAHLFCFKRNIHAPFACLFGSGQKSGVGELPLVPDEALVQPMAEELIISKLTSQKLNIPTAAGWKLNLLASTPEFIFVAVGSVVHKYSLYKGIQHCQNTREEADFKLKGDASQINHLIEWNHQIAFVTTLGNCFVYSVDLNEPISTLFNVSESAWGLALSEKHIAVGANSHCITLYDITTKETHTFPAHSHNIPCVDFSPNGQFLGSVSIDQSVKIWDTETRQLLKTCKIGPEWGWGITWIPFNLLPFETKSVVKTVAASKPHRLTQAGPWEEEMEDGYTSEEEELRVADYDAGLSTLRKPCLDLPTVSGEFTAGDSTGDLMLLQTQEHQISLLNGQDLEIVCQLDNYLTQLDNDVARRPLDAFDRLCMLQFIPTTSLAIVASQKGTVALLRLSRDGTNVQMHVEKTLPSDVMPLCPLLGFAWSEEGEGELWKGRVHLVYYNGAWIIYEVERKMGVWSLGQVCF